MVTLQQPLPKTPDNRIDLESWMQTYVNPRFPDETKALIKKACALATLTGESTRNTFGESCLEQGLKMATILAHLQVDAESLITALLAPCVEHATLDEEELQQLSPAIARMMQEFAKLNALGTLHSPHASHANQLRNMLLAMVSDIRLVLVKLAERIYLMRTIKFVLSDKARKIAEETRDIYAPLAQRLGIGQIKWELEDLCFFYLENESYKTLAKLLDEKRADRDQRIYTIQSELKKLLAEHLIPAEVTGRSKHIYSIHAKMQRKQLSFAEIYDASALRITVDTIEECYKVLGIVHQTWPWLQTEFDDYIAHPKPNGYQSIHTIIIDAHHKNIEIQIRTHDMHHAAEMGGAAHWVYKEGKTPAKNDEEKITRLRQLLAWHQDIARDHDTTHPAQDSVFADQVYVFTPAGDIIDLQKGATPLDFAYRVHTTLGHRCRGAKVNEHMVPLTHTLRTGDRVAIIGGREIKPSRDWLNAELGYLKTARARAKVQHWFSAQENTTHIQEGKDILDKELLRLKRQADEATLKRVATELGYKNLEGLYSAISKTQMRLSTVTQLIPHEVVRKEELPLVSTPTQKTSGSFVIQGVDNLLTQMAKCCRPIAGEAIIGYITQARGISVHKKNCHNLQHLSHELKNRLIDISWGKTQAQLFEAGLTLHAVDRANLLRDITATLANEKTPLTSLNTRAQQNKADIGITIEVASLEHLQHIIDKLSQISGIVEVKRTTG